MIISNNLLVFILALSFLLFTHELGHFLIGKLLRIEAEEFGFGYPPRLARLFRWGKTDFTLNWIPFGAFVRFKGEDDPNSEGGFYAANKWQRLGTLLAGPGMNILVGIILFSLVIARAGYADTSVIRIAEIAPDSPAAEAGMLPGDQLLMVNGQPLEDMTTVSAIVKANLDQPVTVTLLRDTEEIALTVVPRSNPPEGQGAMGIVMEYPIEYHTFLESIPLGAQTAWYQIRELFSLPGQLIRGEVSSQELRPLSPKGLYDVYDQVRESEQVSEQAQPDLAFLNIAWFFAIISTALGISNLLPIPALDGGRILFILPEIFLGKRVPSKYENTIHMVGYMALLALMAYIFMQDFINPIVLP